MTVTSAGLPPKPLKIIRFFKAIQNAETFTAPVFTAQLGIMDTAWWRSFGMFCGASAITAWYGVTKPISLILIYSFCTPVVQTSH